MFVSGHNQSSYSGSFGTKTRTMFIVEPEGHGLRAHLRVSVPLWLTYRTAKTPMTLFSNSLSFALIVSGRVR